ncbi:MAG TPA: aminotransferase class V-fold PLP-dependent enzyme [Acidimicrobiales bacterium]|nr:aminotransferase class V-fold PLP-dependent enzyme [Acidimicrobiales bacterium]
MAVPSALDDDAPAAGPLAALVGADQEVPVLDGSHRRYVDLDCAASTSAMVAVAERVTEFVPWYSSVHRGAGYRSRVATAAYEEARGDVLAFGGRAGRDDVAIICRNTTEALNHLAYRLALGPADVVVSTVVEHHANLLPWGRLARQRFVECGPDGTFDTEAVVAALDAGPHPALLAVTGASNVTGWLPPLDAICEAARARQVPVVVDAAQLAPHRPLPAGPDFIAFSGHKLYAPYGAGALIGPRDAFTAGDPFLAGGGAVDLVTLDEVIWTEPPEREEAGSPNVIGAVAMAAALGEIGRLGWEAVTTHEAALAARLRSGLAALDGVTLLGPPVGTDTLSVAAFAVGGQHHALVAARLSAEWGIGVRHGCFCAHPYLLRLLGVGPAGVEAARRDVRMGDRRRIPGAVRASCGLGTTGADVDLLLEALGELVAGRPAPVPYHQDPATGDFWPETGGPGWSPDERPAGAACARG